MFRWLVDHSIHMQQVIVMFVMIVVATVAVAEDWQQRRKAMIEEIQSDMRAYTGVSLSDSVVQLSLIHI